MSRISIINKSSATLPRVAFDMIKNEALGKAYKLNLIIASPAEIKKLNLIYRGKNTPTDILSFPLSKNEGDMYICISETKKEAKKFDRSYENFFAFLFIHGCVHLIGHDHGSIMENIEKKLRTKFKV